jgi:RNA polymerase sigma-70 factor (ECF subfamily)
MGRRDDATSDWIAQLYDRHAAGLYRYALMVLANREEAADAVHQVFTRLIDGRSDRPEAEQNYLKRAVRNECFSILRGRQRERVLVDSQPLLDVVHAADDRIDDRLMIERALRELPPEQREVVHLKIFEGMTFQDIADLCDESISTIASRYRYAIEKMRILLNVSDE